MIHIETISIDVHDIQAARAGGRRRGLRRRRPRVEKISPEYLGGDFVNGVVTKPLLVVQRVVNVSRYQATRCVPAEIIFRNSTSLDRQLVHELNPWQW